MFNSDGYILLDFTGVDITKTNQYLKGIYQRVINSIDTNKLALVINAGNLTPQAAIIHKRLNYYVITTSLYIFTVNSNDIIIIEQSGQSQVDVAIVPTLTEGVKVADYTIGAVEGSIYAPEFQTEINDNVTASNTTWSSNKISDDLALKANTSSLAPVATSGDYTDLTNKPAIPTKTSDLVNDSGFITSAQVPTIDDTTVASDKVWSSYKTSAALGNKANSTDVYNKSEIDTALLDKANSADVYTKSQVDTALATKQGLITSVSHSITPATSSTVSPFSYYGEYNFSSDIGDKTVLSVVIEGGGSNNAHTYSFVSKRIRIYANAADALTVTLFLI